MATLTVKYSIWTASSNACDPCQARAGLWWYGTPSRPHMFCSCTIEEGKKTVKLVYKEESRKLVNTQIRRKMIASKGNSTTTPLKWEETLKYAASSSVGTKKKFGGQGGWDAGDDGGWFIKFHSELEKISNLKSSVQKEEKVNVKIPVNKRVEVWKTYTTKTFNIKYRVYWEIPLDGGGVRLRKSYQTFTKSMQDIREDVLYLEKNMKKPGPQ